MSDLRYYGFKMEVENESGVKKIVEFRRAVTDVDQTVDKLNETLGDNITVTASKVQGDKEALAQARLFVTQQERQNSKTKQVIEQYTKLNSTIQTYGNDLETVTAITRLGSNATDQQRQEVAALVKQYQLLRNSGDATRGSMRNLRGTFQNLGWQLQDTVVQAQMGTSAFVILSQQGSQMLSSFGAWGAIAGAGVAVVGAVMPALISHFIDASASTKELEDAQKLVNASLSSTAYTVNGVSKELKALYDINSQLAELQVAVAFQAAETAMKSYQTQITETFGDMLEQVTLRDEAFSKMTQTDEGFGRQQRLLIDSSARLSNKLGVITLGLTDQNNVVIKLARGYKEFLASGDNTGLSSALTEIAKTSYDLDPEVLKLITDYVDLASKVELSKAQLEELNKLMTGGKTITDSYNQGIETTAQKYQLMTEQLKMTDAQKTVDNFRMKEGLKLRLEEKLQTITLIETYYKEKEAIDAKIAADKKAKTEAEKKLADSEKQRLENLKVIESYQKLKDQVNLNERQQALDTFTRSQAISMTEQQRQTVTSLINTYYDEKTALEAKLEADKKAQAEQKKRNSDTLKDVKKIQDSLTGLNSPSAGNDVSKEEMFYKQRIELLEDAKKRELDSTINYDKLIELEHDRHTSAISQAYLTVATNTVSYMGQTAGFLTSIVDGMASGSEDIKAATAEMNDAQKVMFFITQSVAAASALINGIDLGMKLAALYPLAAPAMVATGTGLGAASAGVIMGTTFEGMFDNGGYIPQGKKGIVSEYSDELVNGVMVKGPARVTSSEETAKMMSNGTSSGSNSTIQNNMNIVVENSIPGGNYSISQVDENTVKVIATQVFNDNIDGGVASSLSQKGSKSDKAMRNNFNTNRTYS